MANGAHRVFHIHAGHQGGAANFFVRLVRAFSEAGIEQMANTRPDRPWHADLEGVCEIVTESMSERSLHRRLAAWRRRKRIERFDATVVMAWMNGGAKRVPDGLENRATLVRLGNFPTYMGSLRRCDHLVGNTPEIVRRAIGSGWPGEAASVISNFVDPNDAVPADRQSLGFANPGFLVVAPGRFVERKGFVHLLQAMRRLRDVNLCLVGDGPQRNELAALVRECGLGERVSMPGWVADVKPLVRAADCLCCPSTEEPLGNVVLEGWAAGVPVVAAASEGPSWLIEDGVDGLLCRPGDPEALAQAIESLRKGLDGAALARAGRTKLDERFSRASITADYVALFDRLTGRVAEPTHA